MNHRLKSVFWGLTFLISCTVARSEVQFVGVVGLKEKTLFLLSGLHDGPPLWLTLGQSYGTYTLVWFQPKEEILLLKAGDNELALKLRDSKVLELPPQVQLWNLMDTARQEIARRENWTGGIVLEGPKRTQLSQKDNSRRTLEPLDIWTVTGSFNDSKGELIRRMIILKDDGSLFDYTHPAPKQAPPSSKPDSCK